MDRCMDCGEPFSCCAECGCYCRATGHDGGPGVLGVRSARGMVIYNNGRGDAGLVVNMQDGQQ